MSRRVAALLIGVYGIALALIQMSAGGVRTDEAKYLLNIPYPQPPLARFLLSLTESLPIQEALWRIVFALLLTESVFLVWDISRELPQKVRLFLAGAWLFSAALVLQAGSILMSTLTGVQALAIVWFWFRSEKSPLSPAALFFLSLLWLASLFTAYQIVLFLPLVIVIYHQSGLPRWQKAMYAFLPVAAVFAYALTNPFILGSFINAGSENLDIPLSWWLWFLAREWITGGSLVLSLLGFAGLLLVRRWGLILSFLLVSAFVFLSFRDYYDLYFTPLFIAGAILLFRARPSLRVPLEPLLAVLVAATCVTAFLLPPVIPAGPARQTIRLIQKQAGSGSILIAGPFGHQWQYESRFPIRRYTSEFLPGAQAAICLHVCRGIESAGSFARLAEAEGEVWVRR